jgi:hypothetical protein
MTVETTGLWTLLTEAAFQEGTRRSVGRNHPHVARQDFIEGVQWALEQGIVQEMVAALEGLEWAAMPRGHGNFCPSCQRQDAEEGGPGHTADCSLALLLTSIRGQETADDE